MDLNNILKTLRNEQIVVYILENLPEVGSIIFKHLGFFRKRAIKSKLGIAADVIKNHPVNLSKIHPSVLEMLTSDLKKMLIK